MKKTVGSSKIDLLEIISFTIGISLVMISTILILKQKVLKKYNSYFIIIMLLAGVQRILFGLYSTGHVVKYYVPLNGNLYYGTIIVPIFYLFFKNSASACSHSFSAPAVSVHAAAAYHQAAVFLQIDQCAQRQHAGKQVQRAPAYVNIAARCAAPAQWQATARHAATIGSVSAAAERRGLVRQSRTTATRASK